jgi:hypothetical protein
MADLLVLLRDYFTGKALDTLGEVVRDVVNPPSNPFEDIRRRNGGEAAFELVLAFERHLRLHESRDAEFREQLREKVTEREIGALFPKLLREATEASTRERMRMLCAALAGMWRPDLEAEMRSRVARAVMELEPSDVLALRRVLSAPTMAVSDTDVLRADATRSGVVRHAVEYEGLLRAGCVADANVYGGGVYITQLGRATAMALEAWDMEAH